MGSSPILGEWYYLDFMTLEMPITSAQKKSVRQTAKRTALNNKFKVDLKVAWNIFRKKVEKGEKLTQTDLDTIYSKIDKAKKKNLFHKKTAARKKARAAKMYNAAVTK